MKERKIIGKKIDQSLGHLMKQCDCGQIFYCHGECEMQSRTENGGYCCCEKCLGNKETAYPSISRARCRSRGF
jgi:hypothetical protein